jgi:hypothetical protein
VGQKSYSGLAALDQLLTQLNSQNPGERAMALFYARNYLAYIANAEPDQQVLRVYQALRLLAEQEARHDPPQKSED